MEEQLSPAGVALVGATALASLITWTWIIGRFKQQGCVLRQAPRLAVPWEGGHVMFIMLGYLLLESSLFSLSGIDPAIKLSDQPTPVVARLFATGGLLSLTAALGGAAFLFFVTKARQEDLGLAEGPGEIPRDILLGCLGFLACTLPVLGIQMIVSQFISYEHDLLLLLIREDSQQVWTVALLTAGFVAPLTEEFLFRVVLQGWLEKRSLGLATGITTTEEIDDEGETYLQTERTLVPVTAVWPIWTSATLFALLHLGQGGAPIPLLFFGAIVGYLYRQSHRLLPCVVLHSLFNLFSLLIFRLSEVKV